MENKIKQNVFKTILSPVLSLIENTGNSIKNDETTYKLSFVPFTINFLFGIIWLSGISRGRFLSKESAHYPYS